jgi:hemolysin activation/secretion protein
MKRGGIFFCLIPLLLSFTLTLWAQDEKSLPSVDSTSIIGQKIKKEGEPKPEAEVRGGQVELEKEEREEALEAEVRFFVSEIRLVGNTAIPTAEFRPLLKGYENKKRTLSQVRKLTQDITARYRERGFLTSAAFLPPQKVTDGIVQIRIVEGKVGDLQVEGNRFFRKKRILAYSAL